MTVDELITCSKSIERKRKPTFKEDYRHYKANIPLSCSIQGIKMTMFLRRLKDLPEDFSVGLKLDGPNEFMEYDIVLVRFQGPHGGQSADKSLTSLHNAYHIHEYTQEDLSCRRKRASYKGDGNFSSFEEAIIQFLEKCNIADPNGIFDEERKRINQIRINIEDLLQKGGNIDED